MFSHSYLLLVKFSFYCETKLESTAVRLLVSIKESILLELKQSDLFTNSAL